MMDEKKPAKIKSKPNLKLKAITYARIEEEKDLEGLPDDVDFRRNMGCGC